MTWLIASGCIVTLLGLAGLILCIRKAAALRAEPDPAKQRAAMHGLVALNMGSMGVAGLGLAMVVVGLIL
ncbi:hypothetical protein [Oceanibium sediminis]|uniref:hypothetical protein n=1 Tax=Oceanibium sediminis TaxID=2026339 RepID=UPI000DD43802|nr:hypothetical protein [Oceanibium sediminis]